MFDEYFKPPSVVSTTIFAATLPLPDTAMASSSTTIDQDAPSLSTSPTTKTTASPINSTNVEQLNNEEDAVLDSDTFTNLFAPPVTSSAESSERIVDTSNMHTFQQPQIYTRRWRKEHPLLTIIGNTSKLVSTRCQLATDAMWCDNALIIHVFSGFIYSYFIISHELSILNSMKYLQVYLKTSRAQIKQRSNTYTLWKSRCKSKLKSQAKRANVHHTYQLCAALLLKVKELKT
ncbi:hypothetical protein Tco_0975026 [Tanacetum coccineum]|uniref:Uncharacterized protein n=1 Tax=Tanacetum coccineum TaxID=301880 RepID=A0ABQ5ED72_9ASTR